MGQVVGRATLVPEAKKFVNLPKDAVDQLWESFNDVAEGFGLSIEEFLEITRTALKEHMELSDKKIDQVSAKAFGTFDDDKNDLVDALEFLAAFALISGMSHDAKANFIFNIYDFDESGELTIDEMTLALRSSITGLAKLSGSEPPLESELEKIAQNAFQEADKDGDNLISRAEFVNYCSKTPEVVSWLEYYDDIEEGTALEEAEILDIEVRLEAEVPKRTPEAVAAMDPDDGASELIAIEEKGYADEFMAVKPWNQVTNYTVPTDIPEIDNTAPDANLELEWVHGYSAQSCRGNLRYSMKGEIVYPAAAVGVVLNADEHKQRFNIEHSDEISCLAVHHALSGKGETWVATGEVGRKPKIHIWSTESMEVLSTVCGLHKGGVLHVSFSPDGQLLASVGADSLHSVVVYDWQKRLKLFSAGSSSAKVLDCVFVGDSDFVSCGIGHITFWSPQPHGEGGQVWSKHMGIFGKKGKVQTILCVGSVDGTVVSGTNSGQLYVWEGRNCKKAIHAHNDAVNALYCVDGPEGGLVTGSRDGKVRLWNSALEPGALFEIGGLGGVLSSVRSVCWDVDQNKILVGTAGSEVYEISANDGADLHLGPLVQGHCADELWGLASHPFSAEYCTVGDDATVRIWNATTLKLERMVKLDTMARTVSYSPDGTLIVIGLGGDVGRGKNKKDGAFVVLNEADLTVAYETRDSKEWISVVRFSPDGKTIAVGSTDKGIYLYNAEDFASKGKCKGHKGPITHLDFSRDSQFIRSNCGAYEILFWSADTGEQQTPSSTMKDIQWFSITTPLAWAVQGVWPPYADGTEILSVSRSASGQVIAVSDQFGRLRLFRYPCVVPKEASFSEFRSHSTQVMCVSFAHDDTFLVTIGGRDRCVMQWHFEADAEDDEASDDEMDIDEEDEEDFKDGAVFERSDQQERANIDDQTAMFALDDNILSDDFAAVKPWLGSTVPPSKAPPENNSEPDSSLKLEWVHGYRAQDCRNNLRYTANNEVIYFAGTTNICLNVHEWQQRYHQAHTDDIICMALHPTESLVATGQMGRVPAIVIWDLNTMKTRVVLKGFHRRAVSQLAFSKDGKLLASVGHDDDHSIAVYDWANGTIKAKARGTTSKVLALDFLPDGRGLIQCGVGHVKFWNMNGRNLTCKRGLLGKKGKYQPLLCIGWAGSSPIIGTADGHLYRFQGRQLQVAIPAHERSVNALYTCNEGLCSGGKDGMVRLWTTSLECTVEVDMAVLGAFNPCVRSVCWNPDSNKILIGTRGSEIFEVSASDGSNLHGTSPLLQGHCAYELWGLAIHPINPEYCTVGDDKTVRVWDLHTRKMLRMAKLDTYGRACAYSPDGTKLAIGLGGNVVGRGKQKFDGKFVVLHPDDLELIHEARDSKKWIQEMKFSPDGNTLAVGSHDDKIYLYDVGNGFAIKATISTHKNGFITHLDFSADSQYLQSNCNAYELLFHESDTGMHIPAASRLKDVRWATWTCTLGWACQGTWPQAQDGTVVTGCDRSSSGQVLASVDEFGKIKLWRYPVVSADASSKTYRGHSARTACCRWTGGDSHLISVGRQDRAIFQWIHDDDAVALEDQENAVVAGDSGEDSDLGLDDEIEITDDVGDFMAVKPWIGTIVPPTNAPTGTLDPPPVNLELEYVYGYQAQDSRNNLRYNTLGEIVYHAAAIGIVYNRQLHQQRFFCEHDADIISLDVSQDGQLVVTGQQGMQPQVHVWDATTCLPVAKLEKFHRRGIPSVAFSPDNRLIVSVGLDVNHMVAVWRSSSGQWHDGYLLASEAGDQQKVLFSRFCELPASQVNYQIVTGGINHIKFWTLETRNLKSQRGLFGDMGKVQPMLCCATVTQAVQGRAAVASGSVSGHIYVWDGRQCVKTIKAHARCCNALYACKAGLISGGKDGIIKIWDNTLAFVHLYDLMEATIPPFKPAVRSVCAWMDPSGDQITKLLVGTQGSEIYEISKDTGSMLQISEAHCSDELWGLATHPADADLFATAGDDCTVRVWSKSKRQMLRKAALDCMLRAVAWSPDGHRLAVGMGGSVGRGRQKKDGAFVVLDSDTMEIIYEGRDSRQWISDCKFSPDGKTLAIGSHDDKIYLYDGKTFTLRAKCEKHNSFITHLDFSADSAYIQSNCGAFEQLFYNAMDGTYINSASQLKDTQWATWSSVLGWPVQGMWPDMDDSDGTDINACHRSNNGELLASADENGRVRVYVYPCLKKGAAFADGNGHSAHVTNIRFDFSDQHLFTTGGNDRGILQWKVVAGPGN